MVMLIVFALLFVFTFVSPLISKFSVETLHYDTKLAFISPNSTYWFGTDSLGADYWCQVWYATRLSIILAVSCRIIVGPKQSEKVGSADNTDYEYRWDSIV